jgi:hypothetical protein
VMPRDGYDCASAPSSTPESAQTAHDANSVARNSMVASSVGKSLFDVLRSVFATLRQLWHKGNSLFG